MSGSERPMAWREPSPAVGKVSSTTHGHPAGETVGPASLGSAGSGTQQEKRGRPSE